MIIDPLHERYLEEIHRTNRLVALHNALVLLTAGGALGIAAIADAWFVAFISLFVLGAIKPFFVVPGSIKLVDPRSMRRVN